MTVQQSFYGDTAGVCGSWSRAMPAGKLWKFDTTSNSGNAYLDNYVERNDVPMTTVYVGSHFEKNLTTGESTSYYTFNGQRVALRNGKGVFWLHGDQLGSASLLTDANGNTRSQLRYKPWGETRTQWNNTPTDHRFTGQREESALGGLYDYGARFDSYIEYSAGGGRMYDPLIGRFLSPDPIVPRPGDPQALNRYSYARSNPTTRIDSNGHADDDPQRRELCKALPMLCSPASPPLANEAQMGESMSVQQVPMTTGDGARVTFFAAKNGNDGKDKGKGGIGGLINALLRLLGLGGGGGAGKVAQELSKDGDPTNEAYQIAQAGGRHAGFLREYSKRTVEEIGRSMRTLEGRIEEHQSYILDPLKKVSQEVWKSMDPRAQQGLLNHWQREINDWQKQLDILRQIYRNKIGGSGGT